jgi:PPOX class probable F420-dependent enzyme
MEIAQARYVAATTFRQSGAPVSTPVWVAGLGRDRVGIVTAENSGKVARLRADPRITLAPCDARGRVERGAPTFSGVADVVTGAAYEEVRAAIAAKYSWQYRLLASWRGLVGLLGRSRDAEVAVVVTLDTEPT